MKKIFIFMVVLGFMFLEYACGGGGGGSTPPTSLSLNNYAMSVKSISKSNPANITFSWNVDYSSPSNSYYMDIYISKDGSFNSNDIPIASKISTNSNDNITITPSSLGYRYMLNLYGGIYYIIFDAYTYDADNKKVESVKTISDVALKNIWTVMVYMDGDNSLSGATTYDLNEMLSIGSDSSVGVIVQDDTSDNTTKRYFIEKEGLELLSDLGELNMGDYNTLINFGKWAIDNYPADHYMLILWDHGRGFENAPSKPTKDILWDDHPFSNYSMSIPDLSKALLDIKEHIGKNIDIIGMDACLMNMLEVAYEIRNSSDYMVGSENTEPYNGWPYDSILSTLEDNISTITPEELSKTIVKSYIDSYTVDDYPTLSSVNLKETDNLTNAVNNLAISLLNGINSDTGYTIKSTLKGFIFDNVQRFDDNGDGTLDTQDSYVDLYDLTRLIYQNDNMTPQIKNTAANVLNVFKNCIIANGYKNSVLKNSYGVSIWFPNSNMYSIFKKHYSELEFVKDTKWDELLNILISQ